MAATTSLETGTIEHVDVRVPATLVWGYGSKCPRRAMLYEEAKVRGWDAAVDLDWSLDVDPGVLPESDWAVFMELTGGGSLGGPLIEALGDDPEVLREVAAQHHGWLVSQVLHGEQGALVAAAEVCATAESIDDKLTTAALVADEARHVEAYQRYLGKLGISYPVSPPLHELLSQVVNHRNADVTYLGTQILVEGVAGTACRMGGVLLANPLIRQVNALVSGDEARHVAYGVLFLRSLYEEMSTAERREREDFVIESCRLLGQHLQPTQVWEHFGLDTDAAAAAFAGSCDALVLRSLLLTQVTPTLHQLGLLSPRVRIALDGMGLVPLNGHIEEATVAPTDLPRLLSPPPVPPEVEEDPFLLLRSLLGGVELISPEPVLNVLAGLADPGELARVPAARLRLQVAGFADGDWLLTVGGNELSYRRAGTRGHEPAGPPHGTNGAEATDVQVAMNASMWTELVAGRISVPAALADETVTVTGDAAKAHALAALF